MKRYLMSVCIAIIILCIQISLTYGAPIHDAAKAGDHLKVDSLLKSGVKVDSINEHGQTALIVACMYGKDNVVMVLIPWKANLNFVDKNGWTPRDVAKYNGFIVIDDRLKSYGGQYKRKAIWNP